MTSSGPGLLRAAAQLRGSAAVAVAGARLALAALVACGYAQVTEAETATSDAAITSVVLQRTACFGACPVYSVEISSTGYVRYNGEEHVKLTGQHSARISADEFDFLVASIKRIGFFTLHDRYRAAPDGCLKVWTDNPSVDIAVTRVGQKKKEVLYYYGCRGLEIVQRIIWLSETIDDVANSVQWVGPQAD